MDYYIEVLKKYAVFDGRARRKEYWYFFLFSMIISILLSFISTAVGDTAGIIGIIYSLGVLSPSIGVSIRRLHDTGRSGWWILLALIPIIGTIWLFVLMVLDSNPESNKYGPNPKIKPSTLNETPASPNPTV